jgi:hypothetical protein
MERSAAEKALSAHGKQLRFRGPTRDAYQAPLDRLKKWAAKDSPEHALLIALTHHGWMQSGSAPCRQSNSRTCRNAMALSAAGVLPPDAFTLWEPVGPQIVSCFIRLRAAHAPRGDLAELWGCYSGADRGPVDLPGSEEVDPVAEDAGYDTRADEHDVDDGHSILADPVAGQPAGSIEPALDVVRPDEEPLASGSTGQIDLVPPEACDVLEYERSPAGGEKARRLESELVKRYEAWLEGRGHEVRRAQIRVTEEARPLVTDTYDVTDRVLYEAKSSDDRATIRLGIGQLYDYLRHFENVQGSLLLPSDPSYDLRKLIFHCGFWVTYPEGDSWKTETTNRDETTS